MIASNKIYEADLNESEEDESSAKDEEKAVDKRKRRANNAEVLKWRKQFAA